MMNPANPTTTVLGGDAYSRHGYVDTKIGSNVYQSPQAPAPLPSSIPGPYKILPAVGGSLQLSGGAYGR